MRRSISSLWKYSAQKKIACKDNYFLFQIYRIVSKLMRLLWQGSVSPKEIFVESIYGVYLRRRDSDVTYEFCLLGDYGTFLSNELEGISNPTVFLDIGANIGLYSLLASKNRQIHSIYAFEPDRRTIPYLEQNVKFNEASKISIVPYALSNSAGWQKLHVVDGHSGASTISEVFDSKLDYQITTVDHEYLNEHIDCPIEYDVFVKIDVEGHEYNVLEALVKWDKFPQISKLFLEFDTFMSDVAKLCQILELNGFHAIRSMGSTTHWDALWVR